MEYNNLLQLIKTISESNISGFQYEDGNNKIVITTGGNALPGTAMGVPSLSQGAENATGPTVEGVSPVVITQNNVMTELTVEESKVSTGNVVTSPLVGTFYAAPSEDAEPFVRVGDTVKKGQTLAIVEAMKLMNDIEAEFEGKVLEVYVENGDSVEYGQPLFVIG